MKLTLVTNHDDWQALYVDGVQRFEGHHIDWKQAIVTLFKVEFDVRTVPTYDEHDKTLEPETDGDFANDSYSDLYFPEKLSEG